SGASCFPTSLHSGRGPAATERRKGRKRAGRSDRAGLTRPWGACCFTRATSRSSPFAAGDRAEAELATARDFLKELNGCLDEPLTWEVKRKLVETLVEGIRVETVGEGAQRDSHVTVTYRFSVPDDSIATHTGVGGASPSLRAPRPAPPERWRP